MVAGSAAPSLVQLATLSQDTDRDSAAATAAGIRPPSTSGCHDKHAEQHNPEADVPGSDLERRRALLSPSGGTLVKTGVLASSADDW
jgi:hypothetical protein